MQARYVELLLLHVTMHSQHKYIVLRCLENIKLNILASFAGNFLFKKVLTAGISKSFEACLRAMCIPAEALMVSFNFQILSKSFDFKFI